MDNILITGSGFVSKHLEEYFNKKTDTKVIKCSRTVKDGCLKYDLSKLEDCEMLCYNHNFNKIFHLASQSSVHVSWEKIWETINFNINSVNNLLEVFAGTSTKLIFAGSSDVYKNSNQLLTEESELESEAKSPYALSKSTTDQLVRLVAKEKHINCTLLRLFTHSGISQSTNFALSNWAKQLAAIKCGKQEEKIYVGDLSAQRDYCDVKCICRAYDLVSEIDEYEIYNVCSGQAYLMNDLLNKLIEISGTSAKIFIDEKRVRKNDIRYVCGSYQKINDKFGWKPLVPIEQTLKELFEYWEISFKQSK